METYNPSHSLFSARVDSCSFRAEQSYFQQDLFNRVMPLYQVIRFVNQAAAKKEPVYITVEKQINKKNFLRFTMKGIFRKAVNQNRQVAFESSDKKTLHLLPVESILSIQLAS